jgi:hypothetical protein
MVPSPALDCALFRPSDTKNMKPWARMLNPFNLLVVVLVVIFISSIVSALVE